VEWVDLWQVMVEVGMQKAQLASVCWIGLADDNQLHLCPHAVILTQELQATN